MRIDFAGVYQAKHFAAVKAGVARATHDDPPWTDWARLAFTAFVTVATTSIAVSMASVSTAIAFAGLGAGMTALCVLKIYWSKRTYESNPLVGQNAFGALTQTGLSITTAGTICEWEWSQFAACRQNADSILLFLSKQEFLVLPKEFFPDRIDFERATTVCQNSVPGRSPLPTVDWKRLLIMTVVVFAVLALLILLVG